MVILRLARISEPMEGLGRDKEVIASRGRQGTC